MGDLVHLCWELFRNPGQKLAQRDAAALQDLFHLSCFMNWLKPKMEIQLGKAGEVFNKILEMWNLGNLGCQSQWCLKKFHNILSSGSEACPSSVVFKNRVMILSWMDMPDFLIGSPRMTPGFLPPPKSNKSCCGF